MRRALHQRLFAPLALAAILLLALVPTAGRLVAGAEQPAALTAFQEDGSAQIATAEAHHGSHAPATSASSSPRSPSGEHDGHDCDYCPLLTATVSLQVPSILLSALRTAVPVVAAATAGPRADALIPGLGSRGPPLLVQG